uniref:Secreted protein n=1 Tax=Ditylenchus dipsaci TaxID=166011 RepID=A0A915DN84_9BILA
MVSMFSELCNSTFDDWSRYKEIKEMSSGRSNFTRETCLSIERTNSIRRSTKIVSVSENSPAYLHCSIDGGSADSDNLVCLL